MYRALDLVALFIKVRFSQPDYNRYMNCEQLLLTAADGAISDGQLAHRGKTYLLANITQLRLPSRLLWKPHPTLPHFARRYKPIFILMKQLRLTGNSIKNCTLESTPTSSESEMIRLSNYIHLGEGNRYKVVNVVLLTPIKTLDPSHIISPVAYFSVTVIP